VKSLKRFGREHDGWIWQKSPKTSGFYVRVHIIDKPHTR
jgi:hypothetical protein